MDLLESSTRTSGDYSGVFEYDGETSFFYLYGQNEEAEHKIVDSIHIFSGEADSIISDVCVQWQEPDERVGLFLNGVLWAVYNLTTGKNLGETILT